MIERLPTPWGLVRLGVAPDHPQLKTVSRAFEKIAARPGFRFFGNVEVGRDVTHDELASLYDAVVYAVGSQTDRRLGIPGEDLPGSWAATELVAWYNGHPDFQHLEFDLSHERAVVIGNGNVALDVARMLALTGGGARADRHHGRRDRRDRLVGHPRDRRARAPRARPGGVDVDRARRARRARGRGRRRRPGRARARSRERGRARRRVERRPAKRRDPARVRVARTGGQATCRAAPVPRLARRDPRRGARRGRGDRPQPPRAGRSRIGSCGRDRRARDDPVRDRLPQRRLPRRRSARGAVRRASRHDPERRGARPRRGRSARSGPVLRRLDQARPDRRHRHEQEGCDRDGRAPARGCTRRTAAASVGPRHRGSSRRARRERRHVRGLGGDRRTRTLAR